ncbi:tryptophanyl-tRNA synthetase [Coniosporium apollinis CBS 100218]|uniref:Tryptophan--tRNA ligase, mitochondrial n=1 Tax=Coniosporium apollinis (strain CBS 100218) TaxID=1168221 RepID=R7YXD1_CONA1|nr:tryptophanyl-tRNA synthetase [Coniosporium apollinis CBS 100218]EON66508.1 tryptophanyl-tRNA synthetase [Coniosporium apollinis CBS 100218]
MRPAMRKVDPSNVGPPQVIFSGIQPTGVPHIGNYLGALQQWVKLQDEASPKTTLLFSIVDLHAITVNQNPRQLRNACHQMLAALLAVGLDPKRSIIFFQSDVDAHEKLMWILSCRAQMGNLSRMTQWKASSKLNLSDNAPPVEALLNTELELGLYSYPVLQAADVLVHRATHVPVGHDQAQHLEFARKCARTFNHRYGTIFQLPETILSPAKRVMSLTQPHLKMSKSHQDPRSRILISDSTEEIAQKVKTALTDSNSGVSYDPVKRPGVSNLIEIMHHSRADGASCEDIARDCENLTMRAFKEQVAKCIDEHLGEIRQRYEELVGKEKEGYLREVAESGAMRARESAAKTMHLVRDAVGLGGFQSFVKKLD